MGPDRPFLDEEFVGRDEMMANLSKVARHETEKRVLLVLGPFGIGKTWLLHRLEAARSEIGIESVRVDFAVPPAGATEWGYVDVIGAIRAALGPDHFATLDALLAAAREESAGIGLADAFATQMGGAPVAGGAVTATVGAVGAGAQVAVGSNIVMAQGDVHYTVVQQGPASGAQFLLQRQAELTEALRGALVAVTATRRVTFVVDAWLKGATPTRDWLCRSILAWILDRTLPEASAVLSDDSAIPEFQQRHPRVHAMPLGALAEPEIVEYWVERRGLAADKTTWVAQACMGHPLTLAMIADLHDQAGGAL